MRALKDLSLEPIYPLEVHYGSAVKYCKEVAQEGIFVKVSEAVGLQYMAGLSKKEILLR